MVWCICYLAKSLPSRNEDTIGLEPYCPLKELFFTLKYHWQIPIIGQYGLNRIVGLEIFKQSLSKGDMVCCVLHFIKYSENSY